MALAVLIFSEGFGHGHLHWCHNPFNEAMISYPGSLTFPASVPPINLDF